jgi:hypothetical protein
MLGVRRDRRRGSGGRDEGSRRVGSRACPRAVGRLRGDADRRGGRKHA